MYEHVGAVTNTSYNSMPTPLGTLQTKIHCRRRGSVADKPCTFRCPSVSEAVITDCATSPAGGAKKFITLNVHLNKVIMNEYFINNKRKMDNNKSFRIIQLLYPEKREYCGGC